MTHTINVLDLFSGIGGFSLGLERAGMTTVASCEQDKFCRQVLAKHWPDVPCHDDVRTLKGEDVGPVQLICGGHPCQPFSQAGQRRGAEDDRHLWPEMHRLVATIRPRWVIAENVAGHISMGLDDVLSDLEGEGYTCWPIVIPACAVDAPHRRDRVWIVANAAVPGGETRGGHGVGVGYGSWGDKEQLEGSRRQEHVADTQGQPKRAGLRADEPGEKRRGRSGDGHSEGDVPNTGQPRLSVPKQEELCGEGRRDEGRAVAECCRWPVEPDVGGLVDGLSAGLAGLMWPPEPDDVPRVAKGVPGRVNKLKALGNSVVPQIPEMIGRAIMAQESARTS